MEKNYYKQLGSTIRTIRRTNNLSQEYMAFKLNISQNMYSKIERGQTRCSAYRLFAIMNVLGANFQNLELLQITMQEAPDITDEIIHTIFKS